jgi:hypothetical protein
METDVAAGKGVRRGEERARGEGEGGGLIRHRERW